MSLRDEGSCEVADFPIACETCLGPEPNIRMLKAPSDKECKICMRPCTTFRWQPGRHARYKSTIICRMCAKIKNVCQVCLFDLKYGLPVEVRDKLANQPAALVNRNQQAALVNRNQRQIQGTVQRKSETGAVVAEVDEGNGESGGGGSEVAVVRAGASAGENLGEKAGALIAQLAHCPADMSRANRDHLFRRLEVAESRAAVAESIAARGDGDARGEEDARGAGDTVDEGARGTGGRGEGGEELERLKRVNPYYKRNRAKVCTFWLRNACNRGELCPFRHSKDENETVDFSIKNVRARYYGQNDPNAQRYFGQRPSAGGQTSPAIKKGSADEITREGERGRQGHVREGQTLRDAEGESHDRNVRWAPLAKL